MEAKEIFNVVSYHKPVYCERCQKCMTDEDGISTIGIRLEAICKTEEKEEFLQKQMGKYHFNREYNFCWECWLDSLFGVKEKD